MWRVDQTDLSKLMFGRAGRLRLARWILQNFQVGGFFFQAQATAGTGDVVSEVRANLENFEKMGLIKTSHRDAGPGRRQYYERLESALWQPYEIALGASGESVSRRGRRAG
jgi:hypothetical protein